MSGLDVLRAIRVFFVNLWLLSAVILTLGRFRFTPPFLSDSVPTLRLRSGGRIILGKVKARSALRLFADGGRIEIADGVFFNANCSINSREKVRIGCGTLFGENVSVYDHNHRFDATKGVRSDEFTQSPVEIGEKCWIGSGVVILKGVTINARVTIGAGAVVSFSLHRSGLYLSGSARELEWRQDRTR